MIKNFVIDTIVCNNRNSNENDNDDDDDDDDDDNGIYLYMVCKCSWWADVAVSTKKSYLIQR